MKRIMYGFDNSTSERCGCKKPCVRRNFEFYRWKGYEHTNSVDLQVCFCIHVLNVRNVLKILLAGCDKCPPEVQTLRGQCHL